MAITTDENVVYNSTEHFYYLTEKGLIKYTGYEYLLTIWPNADKKLEKMGRILHSLYTDNFHNNKKKYSKHREIIEYKIFNNDFNERQAIINALTYIIELEQDSDWFTRYLIGEVDWPKSITNILKQATVLVYCEIIVSLPEDKYDVGY